MCCSMTFMSNAPEASESNIPIFQCSNIPIFNNIPMFRAVALGCGVCAQAQHAAPNPAEEMMNNGGIQAIRPCKDLPGKM